MVAHTKMFGEHSAKVNTVWNVLGLVSVLCAAAYFVWMIKPVGDLRLAAFGYLLLVMGSMISGVATGFWIDKGLLWSWAATTVVGVVGLLNGAIHSNPGLPFEAVFFVLLPGVWLLITMGMDIRVLRSLLNLIPFAALAIAILGWTFWLDSTGRFHVPGVYLLDLGQALGSDSFGYEMRFYPISTLVFVLPFLTMSLVVKNTYTNRFSAIAAIVAFLPSLGLVFIVGRRALLLSFAASVFLVALLALKIDSKTTIDLRLVLLGVAGVFAAAFVANFTGFSLTQMISSISVTEVRDGADVRSASGDALLRSWLDSPFWGNGLGAVIEVPRNIDRPWEFELQYHLILNALGLLGLIVLGLCTLVVLVRAVLLLRKVPEQYGFLIPILAGCFGILIANASNPYLHTPGHYWMLFTLPMAINCIGKLKSSSSLEVSSSSSR